MLSRRRPPTRAHASMFLPDGSVISATVSARNHRRTELTCAVRLWLRALTVADINDPSGRDIEAWARVGGRRLESKLSWPCQEQTSTSAYCIWQKCLRLAYNPSSPSRLRLRAILPLRRPLGAWIKRSHVLHHCYWNEHLLFMRQPDNTFHRHHIVNAIICEFSSHGTSSDLPNCATPISTTAHGNIIHVHAFHHTLPLRLPATPTSTHMLSYIRMCTVQERHILGYCKDLAKLQELLPHITSSNIMFATDGYHHRRVRRATSSWVISSKNGKLLCYGASPVDGALTSLNSLRAELEAIRSLIYWLRLLIKVYSIIPQVNGMSSKTSRNYTNYSQT